MLSWALQDSAEKMVRGKNALKTGYSRKVGHISAIFHVEKEPFPGVDAILKGSTVVLSSSIAAVPTEVLPVLLRQFQYDDKHAQLQTWRIDMINGNILGGIGQGYEGDEANNPQPPIR